MKKKIYIGLGVLVILLVAVFVYLTQVAAKRSPKDKASFVENGLDINVVYGRPFKKGRLIFGEEKDGALQPYGKYWRLGANAATEITFSKNVNFAGKPVNAGSYRMYTVPGPTSFQISLNSELGVLFANNEPDYTKDIVKVDIPVTAAPETEQLTISFNSDSTAVNMDIAWDKYLVRVPITLQ
jgi:hypothetical protein